MSEFSLADLATDGLAVLDAEGIEEAVVIGTSMGGAVAQEFALNFPDRISSLVLLGTFAGNEHLVAPEPSVTALFEQASKVESKIERWRQLLPTIYSPAFLERYEDLALELELKGVRFTTEDTLKWHGRAVGNFEAYDRLPSLSVRSLVVHGTEDPIIPFENERTFSFATCSPIVFIVHTWVRPGGDLCRVVVFRCDLKHSVLKDLANIDFVARLVSANHQFDPH